MRRDVCGGKRGVCGKERCVWWEGRCVVVREVCVVGKEEELHETKFHITSNNGRSGMGHYTY